MECYIRQQDTAIPIACIMYMHMHAYLWSCSTAVAVAQQFMTSYGAFLFLIAGNLSQTFARPVQVTIMEVLPPTPTVYHGMKAFYKAIATPLLWSFRK